MLRKFAPLLVIVAAAALTGCISLTQYVKLNADGSARVTVDTWVDDFSDLESSASTAAATAAQPPTPPPEPTLEDDMGPAFKNLAGITVAENWVQREEVEGKKIIHSKLVLDVDRLDRLNGVGLYKDTTFTSGKKGKDVAFGQVTLNKREKKEEPSPESEELVRKMFEGYTFTYVVEMPGEVKSTNGTLGADKRTVTWKWPLYEFTQMEKVEMTASAKAK